MQKERVVLERAKVWERETTGEWARGGFGSRVRRNFPWLAQFRPMASATTTLLQDQPSSALPTPGTAGSTARTANLCAAPCRQTQRPCKLLHSSRGSSWLLLGHRPATHERTANTSQTTPDTQTNEPTPYPQTPSVPSQRHRNVRSESCSPAPTAGQHLVRTRDCQQTISSRCIVRLDAAWQSHRTQSVDSDSTVRRATWLRSVIPTVTAHWRPVSASERKGVESL